MNPYGVIVGPTGFFSSVVCARAANGRAAMNTARISAILRLTICGASEKACRVTRVVRLVAHPQEERPQNGSPQPKLQCRRGGASPAPGYALRYPPRPSRGSLRTRSPLTTVPEEASSPGPEYLAMAPRR